MTSLQAKGKAKAKAKAKEEEVLPTLAMMGVTTCLRQYLKGLMNRGNFKYSKRKYSKVSGVFDVFVAQVGEASQNWGKNTSTNRQPIQN